MIRLLPWLLPMFAVANLSMPAQAKSPMADFDSYIEQTRAEFGNIGAAVAVVRNDQVVFLQGFGVKEQGHAAKVGPDTLFQIGSTTKAFTTAALGILVDEGKVRWDDPVVNHLPEFQLRDPWLTRNLTVRDTVTHRSGIPDTAYFVFGVMDGDEAVRQLRYIAADGAFRDSYRYSNLMYAVAGKIVAAVSGMSWSDFVRQRLLQPLQMTRSGTSPYDFWDTRCVAPTFWGVAPAGRCDSADARDGDVAMPHWVRGPGSVQVLAWQSYDTAAAAGAIVASAADMSKWMMLNLDEGRFAGRQLIQKQTMQALQTTQNLRAGTNEFPFEDPPEGYAMGWHKARYRGLVHLAHGGGMLGFPAYVALMPERKIGVVVLSNSLASAGDSYAFHKALAFRAFDLLLAAPPRAWDKEFRERVRLAEAEAHAKDEKMQRSRLRNAPPSLSLEQYAGDYQDPEIPSGHIGVRVSNGQLTLSFPGEGAYSGSLEHWHHDVFRLRRRDAVEWRQYPSFILGAEGKVIALSAFGATFQRVLTAERP